MEVVKILNIVLSNSVLSIISSSIKLSFLEKLQIKKTFVKDKIRKTLLLLFFLTFTKNIYNIVIAKKINNYLNSLFNLQITKTTKKDI